MDTPASILDLQRAVFTVGKRDRKSVTAGGRKRVAEIESLRWMVEAYVSETRSGLKQSPLFQPGRLDPSEKNIASYRLGMGLALLVAQRELGTPYLRHVDPLVKKKVVTLPPGTKSRPDLIGLDRKGQWHVVEAKGYQRVTSKRIADAKMQAQQISAINGSAPSTASACVADLGRSPFRVVLDDPQPSNHGIRLEIAPSRFVFDHYEPVVDVLRSVQNVPEVGIPDFGNIRIRTVRLNGWQLGLLSEMYEEIETSGTDKTERLIKIADGWYNKWRQLELPANVSIGLDGIVVQTG